MEALKIIGYTLVSSLNAYALKTALVKNLVRFVSSQSKNSGLSAKNKLKYRQEVFRQKYFTSKNDPKRKNLMSTLIENFGVD